MLGTADTLLVGLRQDVEAQGLGEDRRDNLRRLAASEISTLPLMRDLMVFDAQGYRLINSGRPAPAIENVSDREYFQYHAAHPDRGVHFGNPVHGKLDGTWIITLSRRIDDPTGAFEGVVVATFAVGSIGDFYETFDVGKTGFLGIYTLGGVIITRHPGKQTQTGHNISSSRFFTQQLPAAPMGDWHSISAVDGVDHLGSYRTVQSFPLVVVVGRGVDELLMPWRTDALIHLAVSLCTSALLIFLGIRFTRQLSLQHQAKKDAQRSEYHYRLLADHSNDVIVRLSSDVRLRYVSPASRAVLGYAPHELLDKHAHDIAHPDDRPAAIACLDAIAADGEAPPFVFRILHKNGSYLWAEAVGRKLPDDEGIVLAVRDVAARKKAEIELHKANNKLQMMAMLDGLTGIANRRCFDITLEKEYRRSIRSDEKLALLLIDVDHFKSFNDLYGHQAGDACLRVIAEVMKQQMRRPADCAARYGGEEFAVLLPDTDEAGAAIIGERVRQAVTLLNVPHRATAKGVTTVSVGVAVILPRRDGQSAEDLISRADVALYRAKSEGRDRVCLGDSLAAKQGSTEHPAVAAPTNAAIQASDQYRLERTASVV